jgi:hypothetical protein
MGVITDDKERKWKEEQQDEILKLECLKLVMGQDNDNLKAMPWKTAQRYFTWVKYGNPDMEVL